METPQCTFPNMYNIFVKWIPNRHLNCNKLEKSNLTRHQMKVSQTELIFHRFSFAHKLCLTVSTFQKIPQKIKVYLILSFAVDTTVKKILNHLIAVCYPANQIFKLQLIVCCLSDQILKLQLIALFSSSSRSGLIQNYQHRKAVLI